MQKLIKTNTKMAHFHFIEAQNNFLYRISSENSKQINETQSHMKTKLHESTTKYSSVGLITSRIQEKPGMQN